jgi:hypothetical protein
MIAAVQQAAGFSQIGVNGERSRLLSVALRYGFSAMGPISISAAHFVASVIFLRALSATDFGLFSFLLVVAPFCLSASGALLGASLTTLLSRQAGMDEAQLATHLKANLVVCALAGFVTFAGMWLSRASLPLAALFGLYAGIMTLRWFARGFAYVRLQRARAVLSDIAYSLALAGGLFALLLTGTLSIFHAGMVLAGSAGLGLAVYGPGYLLQQFRPGSAGRLSDYGAIWREIARWSLLGVVLTEMTANAHAYLVTFIAGPKAFALLALGGLMMRPVSLVMSALPDMERPIMARGIATGQVAKAFRCVKEFRTATAAIWTATVLLAGAILIWFPHLILKKDFAIGQAITVIGLWALIAAVRSLRTPEAVFLQAAGEFKALAHAGLWASLASMSITLILLFIAGPVASLCGILAGDLVLTSNIFALVRGWKRRHV